MRAIAGALVVAVSGCASITAVQTADTVGRGNLQWGIEPGMQGISPRDGESAGFAWPHIDLSARYGLTERLDVGVRVGQSVLELGGKLLLTRPNHPRFAVSLAPTVGGLMMFDSRDDSRFGAMSIALPVMFGVKVGGNEVVVAPRAQYLVVLLTTPVQTLLAGGSVGVAIRVSPNFMVMPEVGITVPTFWHVPPEQARFVRAYANGPLLQLKIGLLIGHTRASHPEGNPHTR